MKTNAVLLELCLFWKMGWETPRAAWIAQLNMNYQILPMCSWNADKARVMDPPSEDLPRPNSWSTSAMSILLRIVKIDCWKLDNEGGLPKSQHRWSSLPKLIAEDAECRKPKPTQKTKSGKTPVVVDLFHQLISKISRTFGLRDEREQQKNPLTSWLQF